MSEQIVKALDDIKDCLGWIAFWLFCIALSRCGGERVIVSGDIGINPTIEVHETNPVFDKIHEWMNTEEAADGE